MSIVPMICWSVNLRNIESVKIFIKAQKQHIETNPEKSIWKFLISCFMLFIFRKGYYWNFILCILLISSCAPSRFVEPLEKKQHAAGLALGGSLIDFSGTTIPIPLSSVVYGYGLDSGITVFGSLHLTSLAFNNLQTDIGASFGLLKQNKFLPAISANPIVNIIFDLDRPVSKCWPEIDLNARWNFGKRKSFAYIGCANWFELSGKRAHDLEPIQRWLINPHAGFTYKCKKMSYTLEVKFFASSKSNVTSFVPYKSILGDKGATGVYLGIMRVF